MPDEVSPQWEPKSDRVVQLLAACIRTAIRLRFAREISKGDSIDLARGHDLNSALKTIGIKSEVHRNLPDGRGFQLAVAEAKLASKLNLGTEKIMEIREATISVLESNRPSSSERHILIAALRTAQQESRSWEKAYSRFLSEMQTLYKTTNAQLNGLRLPLNKRLQAQSELEKLIVDATRRAGTA